MDSSLVARKLPQPRLKIRKYIPMRIKIIKFAVVCVWEIIYFILLKNQILLVNIKCVIFISRLIQRNKKKSWFIVSYEFSSTDNLQPNVRCQWISMILKIIYLQQLVLSDWWINISMQSSKSTAPLLRWLTWRCIWQPCWGRWHGTIVRYTGVFAIILWRKPHHHKNSSVVHVVCWLHSLERSAIF